MGGSCGSARRVASPSSRELEERAQVEASWQCVDRLARSLDDPCDDRTLDQRRVDLAHQLLQGTLTLTDVGTVRDALGADGAEGGSSGGFLLVINLPCAKVAELADAPDLGSGGREAVGVQIPPFAPILRIEA